MNNTVKTIGIIPARYASTRFPGKPLVEIGGMSMIQRVYLQAKKCASIEMVLVATDDQRIYDHVLAFGGAVVMTSADHISGTERCAEAYTKQDTPFDVVLNIQGDEPFIQPEQLETVIKAFSNPETDIATLAIPLRNPVAIADPNVVKVVLAKSGTALYFSRAIIPFPRQDGAEYYKHVGLYAYRSHVLEKLVQFQATMLEKSESLEQLRWLENGYKIHVGLTDHTSPSVDVPEDLIKAEDFLRV